MSVPGLQVDNDGRVLRLTLDRPDRRNALNDEVLEGMIAAVADPGDARVVLITGSGEKVFCSGADLSVMSDDATGLERHESRSGLRRLVVAIRSCPLPVVARVQGQCLAGGVGLALGCDIVLASSGARFGLPEIDVGLWPFMVSALLASHVSPKVASELMLTGRRIDAAEAHQVGLVSRVLPAHDFDTEVEAAVEKLAGAPPVAVRLGKAAFLSALETPLLPALQAMQAQLSLLATTADVTEGVSAFFQKRTPTWQGR
ncbi:MAG: enoyl-CoA hydratase [Actinomycetota bacterium]|nr:enoyl-CoA hydratase [Actinomycetota bacterium]